MEVFWPTTSFSAQTSARGELLRDSGTATVLTFEFILIGDRLCH